MTVDPNRKANKLEIAGLVLPVAYSYNGLIILVTAAAVLCMLLSAGALWTAALLCGLAILLLGIMVPVHALPSLALVTLGFLSLQYVPINTQNGAYSVPLLLILVLILRLAISNRGRHGSGPLLNSYSLVWLLVGISLSVSTLVSVRRESSIFWTSNFVILCCAPAILISTWPQAQQVLKKTWSVLAAILAGYGIIEWLLGANPIMGPLYSAVDPPLKQVWEAYRITTFLGHPLVNSTFFVVGMVLSLGLALREGRTIWWAATLLAGVGLILTGSRGGLIAAGTGLFFLLLCAVVSRRVAPQRATILIALVSLPLVALAAWFAISGRINSSEARGSSDVRLATYEAGQYLASKYAPFGAGPGTADQLKRQFYVGDQRRGIESSILQLDVSIGIVGLVFFGLVILYAVLRSLPQSSDVGAALLAYVVAASSFNLIESNRPALYILGSLLGLVVLKSSARRPQVQPTYRRRARLAAV